jgi:hypothetical protein
LIRTRAAPTLAVCVPLGMAFAVGKINIGPLPALGGLASGYPGRAGVTGWAGVSSGWPDLNRRPPRPKRGALAKLRYSPS